MSPCPARTATKKPANAELEHLAQLARLERCRGPTLTARPSSGPPSSRPLSAPRRLRRGRRSSRMDRAEEAAAAGGRRGSRARRRSGASLRGWRQRLARTSRRRPANSRNSHNVGHRSLLVWPSTRPFRTVPEGVDRLLLQQRVDPTHPSCSRETQDLVRRPTSRDQRAFSRF